MDPLLKNLQPLLMNNMGMTKVIQANLQHSRAATGVLIHNMAKQKLDLAFIQEPWLSSDGKLLGLGSHKGSIIYSTLCSKPRTVILANIPVIPLTDFLSRDLTAVIVKTSTESIIMASAYFPHEQGDKPPPDEVRHLVRYCTVNKLPLILCCDCNSHNTLWGSSDTNRRGKNLIEFLISTDLYVMNRGNKPTFQNAIREEVLDLTITSTTIYQRVSNWRVSDEESLSDHKHIVFNLEGGPQYSTDIITNPKRTD